jgi:hypothetical protein
VLVMGGDGQAQQAFHQGAAHREHDPFATLVKQVILKTREGGVGHEEQHEQGRGREDRSALPHGAEHAAYRQRLGERRSRGGEAQQQRHGQGTAMRADEGDHLLQVRPEGTPTFAVSCRCARDLYHPAPDCVLRAPEP